MDRVSLLFLEAFEASIKNKSVDWSEPLEADVWVGIFQMAMQHHVQPMIYEAVYNCPAAKNDCSGSVRQDQESDKSGSRSEHSDTQDKKAGSSAEVIPSQDKKAGSSAEVISSQDNKGGVQSVDAMQKNETLSPVQMILAFEKPRAFQAVTLQTQKTSEFLEIYKKLRSSGIHPLVVKGLVCRSLYPKPDLRLSGDEDLFIVPEEFERCHEVLLSQGLIPADMSRDSADAVSESTMDKDITAAYEVPYVRRGSSIYIELHKSLFPPDAGAYGDLNKFFEGAHKRASEIEIDGVKILTLNPTDHLLYLLCHAFKHFLHSGVGIRQAADIALFANKYGLPQKPQAAAVLVKDNVGSAKVNQAEKAKKATQQEVQTSKAKAMSCNEFEQGTCKIGDGIDWLQVFKCCKSAHMELFAAAIFKIGEKYLTLDPDMSGIPQQWRQIEVDESALLKDMLEGGVYGDSSMSRKHSSSMTVNAVAAERGGKSSGSLIRSVFPPASELKGRYRYLEKAPVLLPAAWISRLWHYKKETAAGKNRPGSNSASESIRIGNQRIELLKKYGIIEK